MNIVTIPLVIIVCCSLLGHATGAAWSYTGATGPDYWFEDAPICGLDQQSPINIYEGSVKPVTTFGAFALTNYDTTNGVTMSMSNNGHSATVSLSGATDVTAEGGGLPNVFKVAQFHFHWGANNRRGSEHQISKTEFPMELHIVHYNTKYANIGEAVDKADGLAVLGFMFEISAQDNLFYREIVDKLASITVKGAEVPVTPFALNTIIPSALDRFYRYSGSLTTPPCYESVTWTVFKDTIKISAAQMEAFRLLQTESGDPIVDNYRPPLPINGRLVEASYNPNIKWGYVNDNALRWSDYYEDCDANSQSPIDISTTTSEFDETIPDFQFNNYGTTNGVAMELSNNGHAAVVTYISGNLAINGGGLPETYSAAQFHFHWGADDTRGSEHTVNNMAYPLELHIVHFKASLGSLGNAAAVPEGLAVLGFFFTVSESDNPALNPIIDYLINIQEPATVMNITAFTLDSILPAARSNFYRYSGSLTTPGCFESVIWTVFNDKIEISSNQLAALRSLRSSDKVNGENIYLVDNYRPVQPLNGRTVKRTFQFKSAKWGYEGSIGAAYWQRDYPLCGNTPTSSQSPIDIKNTEAMFQGIRPITIAGYDSSSALELSNNGHSVVAAISGSDARISDGGFSDQYIAAQFHFHWGASSIRGSEHLINSQAYPLELHIVHYAARHGTLGGAVAEPNGLAVLGFMFEVSPMDNPNLSPIVDALEDIKYPGNKTTMTPMTLDSMFPESLGRFYRYSGSLTTPGCFESVVWTVFTDTIKISERQLQKFRSIYSSESDTDGNKLVMVDNYRPPQPINNRVVYANFKIDPDSAIGVKASFIVCTLGLVVSLVTRAF